MKISFLHVIFTLMKYKVSLAVTFTAITGYIIYKGFIDFNLVYLAISVYLLAGGANSLNEYQERKFDAKMERTKNRPLPSGTITSYNAFIISSILILLGSGLLYIFFGKITALLGLFNIVWYNLIYTNLKKITPFAVVPGSLTGVVPVFMGWTAAGGHLFESTIIFIAIFLFMWQIPHFWLLMSTYGREYMQAGFPVINQKVCLRNLNFIIFSWIMASSVFSMLMPLFIANITFFFFVIIFILNILFIGLFTLFSFGKSKELNQKKSFMSINIYMFLFLILLNIYHLWL